MKSSDLLKKTINTLFITEIFHTNILHQLFDYIITFNCEFTALEHKFKGGFVLKNWFKTFFIKISGI